MAKKSSKVSFSEIGKMLEDSVAKTSIILEDPEHPQEIEYINTGIYLLNALFSKDIYGGLQSNRICALAGAEGVGKSFLCYNFVREAQKQGRMVIFIDTEYSIEMEKLAPFGIDISPEKFRLMRSNVVEDLKMQLAKFLKSLKDAKMEGGEIPKIMMVLDSAGALASRKEVTDAQDGKEKADMTRAKAMGSMFRIISSDLGYLDIPLIVTNHTYLTTDMFPQEIMKGGKGLYYTASTILFLSKAKLKTGNEDELDQGQSGIVVSAKAKKNRLAKPKKIKFEIDFTKGCNPYKGLEAFCRPETFETVGIAKGKFDADGNYVSSGNKWAIKSTGKTVWEKQLHKPDIFTKDVLDALQPIIYQYFEYADHQELEDLWNEFKDMDADYEKELDLLGVGAADISDEDLFS